jgi:hypothetical protein
MFGIMRAGGIAALSSPGHTEDEMVHVFRTVKCRYIFTSLEALGVVRAAARRVGIREESVFVLDGSEGEGFRTSVSYIPSNPCPF